MCLNEITKSYDPPLAEELIAWKVGYGYADKFTCWAASGSYAYNQWYAAGWESELANDAARGFVHTGFDVYPAGFHCFEKRSAAEMFLATCDMLSYRLSCVSVRIRQIVARGLEPYGNVVVAKEIMFLKE